VGTYAFSRTGLESFAWPVGATTIPQKAFFGAASLKSITGQPEYLYPSNVELLWHGAATSGSIFLAAALLDLTCLNTVRNIIAQDGGKLYATAWKHNVINHLIIAPIVYLVGVRLFESAEPVSLLVRFLYLAGVMTIHSLGYYCTHRAMHTTMLWKFHKYHHKFNTFICPIAASAVTQVEYMFAYLIPFIVAGVLLRPMPLGTIAASGLIIGHVNNLIHTPWMEDLSEKLVPWFGVSTAGHFHHHRQLDSHYAAPTLNIDELLHLSPKFDRAVADFFFGVFGKAVGSGKAQKQS